MKRKREKGVPESKCWYKLDVTEYKPLPNEPYISYIQRIYSERPNAPNYLNNLKWEQHDGVPLCCGGDDSEDNKIWLLLQEHYWAHMLLHKENPDNLGLLNSLNLLTHRQYYGIVTQEEIDYINSEFKRIYNSNNVTLPPEFRFFKKAL